MNDCGYHFPDCLCGHSDRVLTFDYQTRPLGETDFGIADADYARQVLRCVRCGHYVSVMSEAMEQKLEMGYQAAYVDATYKDEAGMLATFERIMNLPPERSDNQGRVNCVNAFLQQSYPDCKTRDISILDVGAGLGVFPAAMHARGYTVTALDPDERTAAHAQNTIGVTALCCEFINCPQDKTYDVITFNKVLEHIKNPCSSLVKALSMLSKRGMIYLELPDGTGAEPDGPGREEFFIEHHHVFSPESATQLAQAAGYDVLALERLREPSDKYTLRLFIEPATR